MKRPSPCANDPFPRHEENGLGLEETGLNLTGCPAGIYCGKVLNFRGILADFEKRVFEPVP